MPWSSVVPFCCLDQTGAPFRGYRGGARGAPRGRQPNRPPRESPLKFEGDFDFETENAKFDKENIEKELKKKLTISEYMKQTYIYFSVRFIMGILYN